MQANRKIIAELFRIVTSANYKAKATDLVNDNSVLIIADKKNFCASAKNDTLYVTARAECLSEEIPYFTTVVSDEGVAKFLGESKTETLDLALNQQEVSFIFEDKQLKAPFVRNGKFNNAIIMPTKDNIVSALGKDIAAAIKSAGCALELSGLSDLVKNYCVEFKQDEMKIHALSDSNYCLVNVELTDADPHMKPCKYVVDGKAMNAIAKIFEKCGQDVYVYIFEQSGVTMMGFCNESNTIRIAVRIKEDSFVDVKPLLGGEFTSSIVFDTKEAKKMLNDISKSALDKKNMPIEIKMVNETMAACALKQMVENIEKVVTTSNLPAIRSSEMASVTINAAALKKFISAAKGTSIRLAYSKNKLMKLTIDGSDDIIYVAPLYR
jgi:hypothetical protein